MLAWIEDMAGFGYMAALGCTMGRGYVASFEVEVKDGVSLLVCVLGAEVAAWYYTCSCIHPNACWRCLPPCVTHFA